MTDVGGCSLTTELNNGIVLVSKSDNALIIEISEAIKRLLDDNVRKEMSLNSQMLFAKRFSNKSMIRRYAEVVLS